MSQEVINNIKDQDVHLEIQIGCWLDYETCYGVIKMSLYILSENLIRIAIGDKVGMVSLSQMESALKMLRAAVNTTPRPLPASPGQSQP